jgi:hypothetical protein
LQSIANGTLGTVAYTFTPNGGEVKGCQVQLLFGGALNAASGYVDISLADIRVTPGVSTGLNSNPPPPEQRPISMELQSCMEYFETSYDLGTAPGSATNAGMVDIGSTVAGDGTGIPFKVRKRATSPTMTYYDGAGNSNVTSSYSGGWSNNQKAVTALSASTTNAMVTVAVSSNRQALHFTASSEL